MNTKANKTSTERPTEAQPATATATATATEEQQADPINKPLRSTGVSPAISAAPQTARGVLSEEELRAYRAMPYEKYLLTALWRLRRNRALRLAGYKCSRCGAGRQLQAHHLTYDRLGAELDEDLQVLCRGCHLGEHVLQLHEQLAVYRRVISAAIQENDFTSIAELSEDVKQRCARARIPYDAGQVQAALSNLGTRLDVQIPVAVPPKYAELLHAGRGAQPLTHAEACGLLAKYGAHAKAMPTVRAMTQRQADRRIVARQLAALVLEQVKRCEEAEAVVESGS